MKEKEKCEEREREGKGEVMLGVEGYRDWVEVCMIGRGNYEACA